MGLQYIKSLCSLEQISIVKPQGVHVLLVEIRQKHLHILWFLVYLQGGRMSYIQ